MAEVRLPTSDEIQQLPRWARVAFAARCARRALPFFRQSWRHAPEEHLTAVERAVSAAEAAADSAYAAAAAHAAHAAYVAYAAAYAAAAYADAAYAAAYADAAYAAYAAADAATADTDARVAAVRAARAGVNTSAIAADFQLLRTAALAGSWTDSTPVPPTVFSPLNEVEAVIEPKSVTPTRLTLKAYLQPSADSDAVGDKLVELFQELNEYSLAKYGRRLSVEDFEQFLGTGVLQPVPSGGPS